MTQEKRRPSPQQEFDGGAPIGRASDKPNIPPTVRVAESPDALGSPAKLLYTVAEAAQLLSLSRAHLYRLLEQGDLVSVASGRARRISRRALEAYVCDLEEGGVR